MYVNRRMRGCDACDLGGAKRAWSSRAVETRVYLRAEPSRISPLSTYPWILSARTECPSAAFIRSHGSSADFAAQGDPRRRRTNLTVTREATSTAAFVIGQQVKDDGFDDRDPGLDDDHGDALQQRARSSAHSMQPRLPRRPPSEDPQGLRRPIQDIRARIRNGELHRRQRESHNRLPREHPVIGQRREEAGCRPRFSALRKASLGE